MYTPAVILLLIGTALSAPTDKTPTAPCCPPNQWQADIFDVKSAAGLQYVTRFAFDADMKADGSVTTSAATGMPVFQTFTNFTTMTMYSVNMVGDQSSFKCEKSKADSMYFDNCYGNAVLGDVKYIADGIFGSMVGGVKFDAWAFHIGGLNITSALSRDGCAPLLTATQGTKDGNVVDSLSIYTEFKTTYDPQVIAMPAACKDMS